MLKDKTILITGSSSGIGAATARLAKEYGAKVILHGKDESEKLKSLAKELDCEYIFCDVGDRNAVDSEVKRILEKTKKIDLLVNNVGMALDEDFFKSSQDVWDTTFQGNFFGTVNFCRAVIPVMLENKFGKIVNVSSLRGHSELSSANRPAYSAAKAAVINLTASTAKLYGPNILVNCISPGFTLTPLSNQWSEKSRKESTNNLIGRVIEPEEIAETILFLVGDKNTAITGQTILVDGGYSISGK